MEELASLLEATDAASANRLLVVNGPNINMLGVREPKIYGRKTYADLVRLCRKAAREAGFSECRCFQSNHEGDLVDVIQAAYGEFDGIVINPAAYTHTSVALLDALKSVALPTIEVHISKVDEREDFRQVSYVRAACFETIVGMGLDGYRKAIKDMAAYLREHKGAEKN
ncbi:3-dehydroquinate dehydratase [Tractidigestivibacter scatoligenes]|uniref:3-dehydroquinate dehydratase n=2 Tax=Tractidigestivibacter scatoligenes TaxID=1299998 RepID=A0A117J4P7_TRASO|nr:3-dehydroquinate dehydratase [Tractidigestivibacter scatoligenes]